MNTVELALHEVAEVLDKVGEQVPGPASVVLKVAEIVVRGAEGVTHILTAEDVEAIRRSEALNSAAGLAAYLASKAVHGPR